LLLAPQTHLSFRLSPQTNLSFLLSPPSSILSPPSSLPLLHPLSKNTVHALPPSGSLSPSRHHAFPSLFVAVTTTHLSLLLAPQTHLSFLLSPQTQLSFLLSPPSSILSPPSSLPLLHPISKDTVHACSCSCSCLCSCSVVVVSSTASTFFVRVVSSPVVVGPTLYFLSCLCSCSFIYCVYIFGVWPWFMFVSVTLCGVPVFLKGLSCSPPVVVVHMGGHSGYTIVARVFTCLFRLWLKGMSWETSRPAILPGLRDKTLNPERVKLDHHHCQIYHRFF
jgi:hypothetical protein